MCFNSTSNPILKPFGEYKAPSEEKTDSDKEVFFER